MRLFAITRAGKKISGNIVAIKGEQTAVLQYLHDANRGTIEDIASGTALTNRRAGKVLSKLEKRGLVTELTKKERGFDDGETY